MSDKIDGKLVPSDENDLAAAIRQAIGAGPYVKALKALHDELSNHLGSPVAQLNAEAQATGNRARYEVLESESRNFRRHLKAVDDSIAALSAPPPAEGAPRGFSDDVARKLLLAHDAFIAGDYEEVYHQLYAIVEPTFSVQGDPFARLQEEIGRAGDAPTGEPQP